MSEEIQVIESANLSEESMAEVLSSITTETTTGTATSFSFRKSKDEAGNVSHRTPLVLALPLLSTNGLISIIEQDGKGLELLLEAANSVIEAEARGIVNDNSDSLSADQVNFEQLAWETIANKPKAQRGGGIPKEAWESFITDYCTVMPDATGKPLEKVQNMAAILKNKLAKIATNKPILEVVMSQLAVYMEASEAATEHAMVVEFLVNKADKLMNAEESDLLDAL